MKITENSAYIKGLFDGLGIDPATPEGKLFDKMLGIIGDMAESIAKLEDECKNLRAYIEEIDEDLGALEEEWYCDDDDCDCCDDDDCDCDDCCEYFVKCPACGDEIYLDEEIIADGEIECPGCGETLEFDLDECEDDCCCGCHDDEE